MYKIGYKVIYLILLSFCVLSCNYISRVDTEHVDFIDKQIILDIKSSLSIYDKQYFIQSKEVITVSQSGWFKVFVDPDRQLSQTDNMSGTIQRYLFNQAYFLQVALNSLFTKQNNTFIMTNKLLTNSYSDILRTAECALNCRAKSDVICKDIIDAQRLYDSFQYSSHYGDWHLTIPSNGILPLKPILTKTGRYRYAIVTVHRPWFNNRLFQKVIAKSNNTSINQLTFPTKVVLLFLRIK